MADRTTHVYHEFRIVNGPSHEDLMLASWSRRPGETHEVHFKLGGHESKPSLAEVPFLILGVMTGFLGQVDLVGVVHGEFLRQLGWRDSERRLAMVKRYNYEIRYGALLIYDNKSLNPIFDVVEASRGT